MKIYSMIKGMVIPCCLLSVWFFTNESYLLPRPLKIWDSFFILLTNGTLFSHVYFSLFRVLLGFSLAFFVAMILVLLFYYFPTFRDFCKPSLDILKHIPPLAALSLLILWFGIGEVSKIVIVFMASFFPILLNMENGVLNCDYKLVEVGKVANFSRKEVFKKIIVPYSLPSIITGIHLGLTYAWRSLIGAELVATSFGLGYMILDARELSRPDIIIVGILVLGIVGALIDLVFMLLVHKIPYLKQGTTNV